MGCAVRRRRTDSEEDAAGQIPGPATLISPVRAFGTRIAEAEKKGGGVVTTSWRTEEAAHNWDETICRYTCLENARSLIDRALICSFRRFWACQVIHGHTNEDELPLCDIFQGYCAYNIEHGAASDFIAKC